MRQISPLHGRAYSSRMPNIRTAAPAPRPSQASTARTVPLPLALLSRPARLQRLLAPGAAPGGDLLDAVETQPHDRVLIIGGGSADLLCATVRRGCRSATCVTDPPAHPVAAEVVVAPRLHSEDEALSVARSARHALSEGASGGRLALRLLGEKARGVALSLVRRLRGDGFRAVHVASGPDGAVVVTCRLHAPLPGRHPAR
ncbi:Hypothetical protein RMHFA_02386 [Roseomonas mucosa]|nr:Hypothetical protein RMHFA_02386 [Roseomonas mucosa]